MKLLFLTNMPSYHQMELAARFVEELGMDNFRIAFHKPTSTDRSEMGWKDGFEDKFILRFWESAEAQAETEQWIATADVVIQGRFPTQHIRQRVRAGRLTFAYQERYFKRQFSYLKAFFRLPRIIRNYWSLNCANYHLLAAGAYTAGDLKKLGMFKNRSWKFGYFIEPSDYQKRIHNHTRISILWCARFSEVKQPDQVLEIAHGLKQRNLSFHITMIGDGQLKQQTQDKVRQQGLSEDLTILGWQPANEVKHHMVNSDVFLMTSHQGEGWGIVVNEAMSNGCATVVNQVVGSAPWLIEHGRTGLIYTDDQVDTLLDKIAELDRSELLQMGREGHQRISENWSCKFAAQRFIQLANCLQNDSESAATLFQDGPCSAA